MPLSAVASAVPASDSTVRLSLDPVLDRRATVDGAWWPYSRDAAAELPGLIAAVDQRLGRITVSVGVYRDSWDHIPRHIQARGRQIRVNWFHHTDPRVITLMPAGAEPITLLVIEPGTATTAVEAAPGPATRDAIGFELSGTLRAAHLLTAHLLAAARTPRGRGRPAVVPSFSDRSTS